MRACVRVVQDEVPLPPADEVAERLEMLRARHMQMQQQEAKEEGRAAAEPLVRKPP